MENHSRVREVARKVRVEEGRVVGGRKKREITGVEALATEGIILKGMGQVGGGKRGNRIMVWRLFISPLI